MNAPSQDIKDLLEASSATTGLIFGRTLFVGQEPDGGGVADKVVSIFDTGGGQPDTKRTLNFLGYDKSNRPMWTINFRIMRTS